MVMKIEEILKPDVVRREDYLKLAFIIRLCFPTSQVSISGNESGYIFLYTYKGEELLKIDKDGVEYLDLGRTMDFSEIIEGSIQSVSEVVLRHFATRGISVMRPTNDINRVGEHKLLRFPWSHKLNQIHLNKCEKCEQKGGMKRIYVGEEDQNKYNPEHFYYAGKSRTRDLGWFICMTCQSQFKEM